MMALYASGVQNDDIRTGQISMEMSNLVTSSSQKVEAYKALIQSGRSTIMRTLSQILSEQAESRASRGRLSVIHFDPKGGRMAKALRTSSELHRYLATDQTRTLESQHTQSPFSYNRRIFIMEDLPRTVVELLGSHLRINPLLFARHCADLSFIESYDGLPSDSKDISQLFIPFMHFVNAPKLLSKPGRDLAELHAPNFHVRRLLAMPKSYGGWDLRGSVGELECCMSYWGVEYVDGGWDVVILVDPSLCDELFFIDQPTHRDRQVRSSPVRVQLAGNMESTHFLPMSQLPVDIRCWADTKDVRDGRPIFDQLLDIYTSQDYIPSQKPFECTIPLRKLALRAWVDFLDHAMHCYILTKGEPYLDNTHFSSPISALWAPRTEEWLLGRLVKWDRRLHIEHHNISTIMRSLGIDLQDHSRLTSIIVATEVRQWRQIRDKLLECKSLYDDMAASYIQVMSLRESQTSNAQAKSLGQITLIASLFVPISLVSGIFSMGGRYAPGGDRFWVFFVVVTPIILFVWANFFTRLGPWARKFVKSRLVGSKRDSTTLPVYVSPNSTNNSGSNIAYTRVEPRLYCRQS